MLMMMMMMLSHLEKRKNCRTVIARLPFLGDMSMQLKKELSALVEKHTWNRVILRIIDTTWNIGHNFRLKDQQKTLMKYGVVYILYHAAINITWSIVCSIVLTRSVVLMKAFVQRWIISRLCLVAMAILLIF